MKRRTYLGLVGAGTLALGHDIYTERDIQRLDNPLRLSEEVLEKDDYWTISVIPDTQNYVDDGLDEIVEQQAEWIQEKRDELNIVFALHEGDLVNDGDSNSQWNMIYSALSPLDGEVPYSVSPGNHDWTTTYDKNSSAKEYKERFGESEFENRDWYAGSGPYGVSHSQIFSGGKYDFLHLGLEWEPRDEVINWAEEMIEEHSLPTILTTHSHLQKNRFGGSRRQEVLEVNGKGNHADEVFNRLIGPKSEIFMVLSGHSFGGFLPRNYGEYRQFSRNNEEERVFELLANYQNRSNGGNGWMRNLTFIPNKNDETGELSVTTYSPVKDLNQVSKSSDFSYKIDFDRRFDQK